MPPNFHENNFERDVESVRDFAQRMERLSGKDAQNAFQDILVLGLANAKVGQYSNMHDTAVYLYGLDDTRTVRLAYM